MASEMLRFLVVMITAFGVNSSPTITATEQRQDEFYYDTFPPGFQWGLATSAYQVEGAWDLEGKGESAWDFWTHENNGSNIVNGQNGDVACDSYHKYGDDGLLLRNMSANFYKLSLSWPRIVPTGRIADGINALGIAHYNRVINNLIANGVAPFITLHQWDLPQPLVTSGSWLNDDIIKHFGDFARIAFREFGDRVPFWSTLHEPLISCQAEATFGKHDPFEEPPETPYKCVHNVLKAHATAYRIYKDEFLFTGLVGLTLNSEWAEPKNATDPEHISASQRLLAWRLGWFLDPIFKGDYPTVMRQSVQTRLPDFDDEWKTKLNGSVDFIGLNYFFSVNVVPTNGSNGWLDGDGNFATEYDPTWNMTGGGLPVTPWGMRKILSYVNSTYGSSLPIYVINGCGEQEAADGINDSFRSEFFKSHINELLKAVKLDGANVRGFAGWSLMDNFEWGSGYTVKYGVHSVDFSSPDLTRTPKNSVAFLTKVFADNGFPAPKKLQ